MKLRSRYAKKCLAIGLAASVLLARPIAGQEPRQADRTADREQVEAMLARWEAAWNRHDMAAFAAMFHDDGVWVLWTGAVWRGRRTIEEGHAEVHRTVFRNSVQRERLEELTFVGPDAAVVRFCSTLIGDERTPDTLVRSNKFLVVSKRNGAWGIGWGQNTRLADSVPDSDCFAALRKVGGNANPSAVPVAQSAPQSVAPRDVIRRHLELMNRGDWKEAAAMFASDVRHHLGTWREGSEGIVTGQQTLTDNLQDIFRTFPDWKMEIVDMVAEGESVVVRCRVSGTHLGVGAKRVNGGFLVGVEPTRKRFEVQHIHWYTVRDGRITDHFTNRDDLGMTQQLGVLPQANR